MNISSFYFLKNLFLHKNGNTMHFIAVCKRKTLWLLFLNKTQIYEKFTKKKRHKFKKKREGERADVIKKERQAPSHYDKKKTQ